MATLTKTFLITKGGGGIDDVSSFINREVGRNAALIKSISASSLNNSATYLTLEYLDTPESPIEITGPINGLVTSTITPPLHYIAQYSQPIDDANFVASQVRFTKNGTSGDVSVNVIDNCNDYLVEVNLSGYLTGSNSGNSGCYTVSFSKDVLTYEGFEQSTSSLYGFNVAREAPPYPGLEDLYTKRIKRGKIVIKYAILDSSVFADTKIKTILSSLLAGGELLAYTTAQKDKQTEVYTLVLEKPEPVPDAVYPRLGSMSQPFIGLNKVTLSYRNPIRTAQLMDSVLYAVSPSWNNVIDILPSNISIIDDKTVEIDINQTWIDESITSYFVNLICYPGLQSADSLGGLDASRPYLLPYTTFISEVAVGTGLSGLVGPQGPAGPSGASGASGLSGSPGEQGPIGPAGPSGATGPTGETGPTGPQGPSGASGLSGISFQGNAPFTDNHIVRWDGTDGTTIQGSYVSITDAGNLNVTGSYAQTGITMTIGQGGANNQGLISFGSDQILRVATSGQTLLKATVSINLQSGSTTRLKMDADGTLYPNTSSTTAFGKSDRYWSNGYIDTTITNSINHLAYVQPRVSYTSGSSPTAVLSGDLNYRFDNGVGEYFYWDNLRGKYLGMSLITLTAGLTGAAGSSAATYMSFGQSNSQFADTSTCSGFGYLIPYDTTVVAFAASTKNLVTANTTFELFDIFGSSIADIDTIPSSSNTCYDATIDINLSAGSQFLIKVTPDGDPISNTNCTLMLRRRI